MCERTHLSVYQTEHSSKSVSTLSQENKKLYELVQHYDVHSKIWNKIWASDTNWNLKWTALNWRYPHRYESRCLVKGRLMQCCYETKHVYAMQQHPNQKPWKLRLRGVASIKLNCFPWTCTRDRSIELHVNERSVQLLQPTKRHWSPFGQLCTITLLTHFAKKKYSCTRRNQAELHVSKYEYFHFTAIAN